MARIHSNLSLTAAALSLVLAGCASEGSEMDRVLRAQGAEEGVAFVWITTPAECMRCQGWARPMRDAIRRKGAKAIIALPAHHDIDLVENFLHRERLKADIVIVNEGAFDESRIEDQPTILAYRGGIQVAALLAPGFADGQMTELIEALIGNDAG